MTDHPMTQQPGPEKATAYFELAVSLYLWRWPALTLAVQNEWGGPDSSDKRDWLAGVLADLFTTTTKEVDPEDIEDIALQVLSDEFSVSLEDDSAYDIATAICDAWKDCQDGKFEKIETMKAHFESVKAKPVEVKKEKKKGDAEGDDSESSSGTDAEVDEDETSGGAMEVDGPSREKQEPVIDEDGFELVQGKGKGKGKSSRR